MRAGRRGGRASRVRRSAEATGDPLDGLVNLFDIGIVLAVAFLIAGLSVARTDRDTPSPTSTSPTVTTPRDADRARGRGEAVGTVFRLPDGRLVLADPASGSGATTP